MTQYTTSDILIKVKKDIYGRATFTSPNFNEMVNAKTSAKERIKVCYVFHPPKEAYLEMIKDFTKVEFPNLIDGTGSNYVSLLPVAELLSNKEELEKWQKQSYRIVIQVNNPVDPTFPFYIYPVNGKVSKIGK